MRFSRLGLAVFALSAVSNVFAAPPKPAPLNSFVLRGAQAQSLAKQCSRAAPVGNFKVAPPTLSEKQRLDAALPAFVKMQGLKATDFYFQYGALTRYKKRLIYVNAFQPDSYSRDNWKKVAISVCDGGNSFWGVEFDVARGKFQNLRFNGQL